MMGTRPRGLEESVLPHGWGDLLRQVVILVSVYIGYELVRGLVGVTGYRPFEDATRIIDMERHLHVFIEPTVQSWAITHAHWLLDLADFTYINAHMFVTAGALLFIYLRRNDSFYFVRNMFVIAMLIALIGYSVYPTAPPRLMPQWGFTDVIQQYTGVAIEHGAASEFINAYAAVPSMHVAFALMTGVPMARLVRHHWARVLWIAYAPFITFVVIVTANHFLTDAVLGALTAGCAALLARQLLQRVHPEAWAFAGLPS
jgi:membrane-associated phospholipid phosphatase